MSQDLSPARARKFVAWAPTGMASSLLTPTTFDCMLGSLTCIHSYTCQCLGKSLLRQCQTTLHRLGKLLSSVLQQRQTSCQSPRPSPSWPPGLRGCASSAGGTPPRCSLVSGLRLVGGPGGTAEILHRKGAGREVEPEFLLEILGQQLAVRPEENHSTFP